MKIIKTARRLLVNSPANEWPIANKLKSKVFRLAYPGNEEEITYLGANLIVPTKDTSLVPGLVGGYYERLELELLQALASKSKSILDVGANIGVHSVIASLAQPKDGVMYSFEPVPENLHYLRQNFARNDAASRHTIVETAVGDTNGELALYLSKQNVGTHSASKRTAKSSNKYVVPQTTLDTFVKNTKLKNVDLLKIDVEGFDGHVLRGAQELLAKHRPTLFSEYIPQLLKNCGFDPAEYLRILTKHFKHIFVMHELSGHLEPLSASALANLDTKATNLLLTNNPDHLSVINTWLNRKH